MEPAMRWILAALLLLLCGVAEAGRVPVEGRAGLALEDRDGRTTLRLPAGRIVPITRDGPCAGCALRQARYVGERPGAALILLVTYASRPLTPGGMCGAGEEEILSIVRLRPRAREAVSRAVQSCWRSIEADRGPDWGARDGVLRVRRWTPQSGAEPERLAWRIAHDGRVSAVATPDGADGEGPAASLSAEATGALRWTVRMVRDGEEPSVVLSLRGNGAEGRERWSARWPGAYDPVLLAPADWHRDGRPVAALTLYHGAAAASVVLLSLDGAQRPQRLAEQLASAMDWAMDAQGRTVLVAQQREGSALRPECLGWNGLALAVRSCRGVR